MATQKQRQAAKQNIKKAQEKWKGMSKQAHSRRQPEGRARTKPGSKGEGNYYRVVVRDKDQFTTFRYHDIGREGHSQRLAGRRSSGSWSTQAWLIGKDDAHMEGKKLVADTDETKEILDQLRTEPKHIKGDIFEAKPRRNVPEREKPTRAQRRARQENIKKAQAARHSG